MLNEREISALMSAVAEVVPDYVSEATTPLAKRIDDVVAQVASIPSGEKGEKGDPGPMPSAEEIQAALLEKAVALMPVAKDGRDGRDVDMEVMRAMIAQAVSELPKPSDGKDGRDADMDALKAFITKCVSEIPPAAPGKEGEPGKDFDPAMLAAAIEEGVRKALPAAVQKALDELMPDLIIKVAAVVPKPRDGIDGKSPDEAEIVAKLTEKMLRAVEALPKPVDGRDGRDAPEVDIDAVVAKALALIPKPRDGVDGKDAEAVDADQIIEAVVKRLPEVKDGVNGRDGADGQSVTLDEVRPIVEAEAARWQLEFERSATEVLRRAVENMPKPENGKDGKDGLSFETFDVSLEGRTFTFLLGNGENIVRKDIKVPFPLDRGTYRSGESYEKGDTVTYGGSQWIAKKDTNEAPPSDAWRLCVKKGKDGKGSA